MAYMTNFLRLVVIGRLFGPTEHFSFGLTMIPNFAGNPVPPTTVPTAVHSAVKTFFTTAPIGTQASLESVKLNEIGTDGHYTQPTSVEYFYSPLAPGTFSPSPAPQVALAVSLRTAVARGRANSGRFYVPLPAEAPAVGDGRIVPATAINFADKAAALINSLNASMNSEWVVAVNSKVGTGAQHKVTHVEVGRVLDTIRSRRSSLDENYQSNTVVIPALSVGSGRSS
jgi:hypothetical protein